MAYTSQADQIEVLTRELWRLNARLGFQHRVPLDWYGDELSRLAKACGQRPEQVEAYLRGRAVPPTGVALALMNALPLPELPLPGWEAEPVANGAVLSVNGAAS